jgi:hypothetical protein
MLEIPISIVELRITSTGDVKASNGNPQNTCTDGARFVLEALPDGEEEEQPDPGGLPDDDFDEPFADVFELTGVPPRSDMDEMPPAVRVHALAKAQKFLAFYYNEMAWMEDEQEVIDAEREEAVRKAEAKSDRWRRKTDRYRAYVEFYQERVDRLLAGGQNQ